MNILQEEKECYVCHTTVGLERHHIYAGGNRSLSEKHGCWVYLCAEHHRGKTGAHQNRALDLKLREDCQRAFEKTHTREEFVEIFGKSYL